MTIPAIKSLGHLPSARHFRQQQKKFTSVNNSEALMTADNNTMVG